MQRGCIETRRGSAAAGRAHRLPEPYLMVSWSRQSAQECAAARHPLLLAQSILISYLDRSSLSLHSLWLLL